MTKMTIREKIELLNTLEEIEELIEEFNKELTQKLKWEAVTNEEDGFETEQATTYGGNELLYQEVTTERYPRRGTIEQLQEQGVTEYKPYYRTKYREVIREFKDLSEYEQEKVLNILAIKMFFEDIDIEGTFPKYLEKAKKEANKRTKEYLAEA